MKIEQQFHEPEHVKNRQPYRIRIEARDGQAIEIVEQMTSGFTVLAAGPFDTELVIEPSSRAVIIVKTTRRNRT